MPRAAGASKPARTISAASALARAFKAHGVKRMFGLPGGGSSLDLIEAAQRERIPFILARHECLGEAMDGIEVQNIQESFGHIRGHRYLAPLAR